MACWKARQRPSPVMASVASFALATTLLFSGSAWAFEPQGAKSTKAASTTTTAPTAQLLPAGWPCGGHRGKFCVPRAFSGYSDPQLDPVVRSMHQILFGAEVPLGRLDRCMAQQQLDLLKLAAGRAAHLRA